MKMQNSLSVSLETNTLDKEKAPRLKEDIRTELVFALNRFMDSLNPEDCKSVEIRIHTQSYEVRNNDDDEF